MFLVRRLAATDALDLHRAATNNAEFELTSSTRFFPLEYLREWLAEPGNDVLLGAYEGEELLGFVLCQVMRKRWALWHNLFVQPGHRRRGVGQALFGSATEHLAALGVEHNVAFTRDAAALAFHLSNGGIRGHEFTYLEWPHRFHGTED